MKTTTLLILGGVGYLAYKSGALSSVLPASAQDSLAKVLGPATGVPLSVGAPALPGEAQFAHNLGTSVWRVREAARRTGKSLAQLTLADFIGIPEVPPVVYVGPGGQISYAPQPGYVASTPNPQGAPASWTNPTGGSSTWGGQTDQQIRDSFTATYGSEAAGQAAWEAQHAAEVAAHGF